MEQARYAPCHTDTDVRVTFPDADVVALGDTWWNGHYPFIDYSTGGSIDGTIRAAEANVDAVSGKTLAVPGHGPVGGKRELTEFRDMLRSVRDAVAIMKKQGKSADEAAAARPTARYDAKWGYVRGRSWRLRPSSARTFMKRVTTRSGGGLTCRTRRPRSRGIEPTRFHRSPVELASRPSPPRPEARAYRFMSGVTDTPCTATDAAITATTSPLSRSAASLPTPCTTA